MFMKRFLPALAIILCSATMTSCIFARIFGAGSDDRRSPDFSEEQTIPAVIPHEGGTYNYHVNYVVTKWTVPVYYRNFRFMLTFDDVYHGPVHDIVEEALWNNQTDSFPVEIPLNDTKSQRKVTLKVCVDNEYISESDFFWNKIPEDHIPDWGEWTEVYSGTQEGNPDGE